MAEGQASQVPEHLRERYLTLQKAYLQGLPARLAGLRQAGQAQDQEALAGHAHRLVGSAAAYGYDRVSDLAKALEHAARGGPADARQHCLQALTVAIEALLAAEKS